MNFVKKVFILFEFSRIEVDSSNFGKRLPGIVLFIITPLVGEVLPGARSILSFLNPLNFIVLTTLYGFGAIIIRETAIRLKKGWPTIFLFGLAYGVLEEGLGAQSFTNPAWAGLSVPAMYGRFLGVNWVWVLQIMLYHAFISISLSILIVAILFPERRNTPYVSNRILKVSVAGITLNLIFEVFVLFPYNAGFFYYLGIFSSILILIFLAIRIPERIKAGPRINFPWWLISLIALLFNFIFFAVMETYLPEHVSPAIDFLATLFLALLVVVFLSLVRSRNGFEMLFYVATGTIVYYAVSSMIFNPVNGVSAIFFIFILTVGRFRLERYYSYSTERSLMF